VELCLTQCMEDDDLVDTVDELGTEDPFEVLHRLRAHDFVLLAACILVFLGQETDTDSTFEIDATSIAGHDDDGVLEVHRTSLSISQAAIIHDLQERVEDLWMRLLNLVEEDDAVGATTYLLGQLTTFVITNVPRRTTEETGNGMRLHVLGHVEAD